MSAYGVIQRASIVFSALGMGIQSETIIFNFILVGITSME
jgi:hypothetical protein